MRKRAKSAVIRWVLFGTIGLNLTAYYFQKTLIGIQYGKENYQQFIEAWRHNNVIMDINYLILIALIYVLSKDVWTKIITALFFAVTVFILGYNLIYSDGSTIANVVWLSALLTVFCLTGMITIRSYYFRE